MNFYIGNKITSYADNVRITAYDLNNHQLDRKSGC
ncbi:immunoglobulin-like domain-containing protein [Listeria fleischmannii]